MSPYTIKLLETWLPFLLIVAVAIAVNGRIVRRTVRRQDESIAIGKQSIANQEKMIALLVEVRDRLPGRDA